MSATAPHPIPQPQSSHALRLAFVSSVAVVFARASSSLHAFTTDNLPRLAMWLVSKRSLG